MNRPSEDEGRWIRGIQPRRRLIRLLMEGDKKNPCWRWHYAGYRVEPVNVQQMYEGEREDG